MAHPRAPLPAHHRARPAARRPAQPRPWRSQSACAHTRCRTSLTGPTFQTGYAVAGVQKAAETCHSKLQPGGGPRGGICESTRLSLLHHAKCMRAHGVPNYPDPTSPATAPTTFGPPPGINTDAPAFQRAAAAWLAASSDSPLAGSVARSCGGRHALTEVERKATPGADRLPGEPAAAHVRAMTGRADDSSRLQPMRRPHLTSHAGQDNEQTQIKSSKLIKID